MKTKMTFYYRFVKTLGTPLGKLLIRYKGIGTENIPKDGGFILCCNHTSMIDIGILVLTCPRPIRFMAKEELFKNPILAWFFRHMGGFPIARGKGDSKAMELAESIVRDGGILGIFPEGTRTKEPDGHPGRGKAGAAVIASATGADVLPACIHYDGYDGKVHFFRKSRAYYGDIIPNEKIKINGDDRQDIRRASETIMNTITSMWEERA